jgi:hypothetical protein
MQTLEQPLPSPAAPARKVWSPGLSGSLALALVMAGAYVLAADLSLNLLTRPDGVAAPAYRDRRDGGHHHCQPDG